MAKKKFISPFVLFTDPGPGSETGAYSQQDGIPDDEDASGNSINRPMDYGEWSAVVAQDLDDNGNPDYVDYTQWMDNRGFTAAINPKMNPDS